MYPFTPNKPGFAPKIDLKILISAKSVLPSFASRMHFLVQRLLSFLGNHVKLVFKIDKGLLI